MTEDSDRAGWLRRARAYLRDADPVLGRLIDERPGFDPRAWLAQLPPMDLYGALLFQVTGQQLSVAATRRIIARIGSMLGVAPEITAEEAVKLAKKADAGTIGD